MELDNMVEYQTQQYWEAARAWHGFNIVGWDVGRVLTVLGSLRNSHTAKTLALQADALATKVVHNKQHKRLHRKQNIVRLPIKSLPQISGQEIAA